MFGILKPLAQCSAQALIVASFSFIGAPILAQNSDRVLLELSFSPPDVALTPVCSPRAPDIDTIETWSNWDGNAFPNLSVTQIKADINRLKKIDVESWKPKIEKMISQLAVEEQSFDGVSAQLAQISLLIDAGEFEELRKSELVLKLNANSGLLSARAKNALAEYYRNGIGVERDVAYGNSLLLDAGYAGNPDALLTLSKLELSGEGVEGWDLDPKLAVTIAFGTLVGELDPGICNRVARIAREFNNLEIVAQNKQLAHDWYRFAADLGDHTSAWRVVEYHMLAEGFTRDNALMLKYLKQASDAGLPYAQIALARVYEHGALIEQDLDRALELLMAASAEDDQAALTRLVFFLRKHAEKYSHLENLYLSTLTKMSELKDAPGWVFTYLGEDVLEKRGRWHGQSEAIAFFERASQAGDDDGMLLLAEQLVARQAGNDDFERAVDLLTYAVSSHGGGTPSKRLFAMFMCQASDSPRVNEALYWKAQDQAIEADKVEFLKQDLVGLDAGEQPLAVALIQSHALYGRSRALASYFQYLESSANLSAEKIEFWREYADQYLGVLDALSTLEFDLAEVPSRRGVAFGLLREQYRQAGADSALSLARSLFLSETDEEMSQDEIRALLENPALLGRGAAMELLVSLDPSAENAKQIYTKFSEVIDAKGDFQAQVFASKHAPRLQREKYLARAEAIIPCNYKSVKTLARIHYEFGNVQRAKRWLVIASNLIEGKGWAARDLAVTELEINGPQAAKRAKALFEEAIMLGDKNAPSGLFEILTSPSFSTFDTEEATLLFEQALQAPEEFNLRKFLSLYRKAEPEIKSVIEAKVDMPEVYLASAESGDIYSMRTYGLYLRDHAKNKDDLVTSTNWLERSAEGGDRTAMTEYGYALAFGIGTDVNLDKALFWLDLASSKGSPRAVSIVKLVNLSKDTL